MYFHDTKTFFYCASYVCNDDRISLLLSLTEFNWIELKQSNQLMSTSTEYHHNHASRIQWQLKNETYILRKIMCFSLTVTFKNGLYSPGQKDRQAGRDCRKASRFRFDALPVFVFLSLSLRRQKLRSALMRIQSYRKYPLLSLD